MFTALFDTLAYAKKLKNAGFTEEQAEIQAEAIAQIINEQLATQKDIHDLEERLMYKITIRLGSMIVVAVTVLTAIMKF